MANEFSAIGSAIYARIGTAVSVSVYQNQAPQGGTPPYCIYQQQAATEEYVFGNGSNSMVDADYVVKVVSNRHWPTEAMQIYDGSVHPRIQAAPLSVAGHALMFCVRVRLIPPYQDSDMFWHVGGMYRITVQGTA